MGHPALDAIRGPPPPVGAPGGGGLALARSPLPSCQGWLESVFATGGWNCLGIVSWVQRVPGCDDVMGRLEGFTALALVWVKRTGAKMGSVLAAEWGKAAVQWVCERGICKLAAQRFHPAFAR